MTNQNFVYICKRIVCDYANDHLDKSDHRMVTTNNVYVVWLSKVLQNNKALLSTSLPDGMYYEISYNGDKNELYFDAYKKFENRRINPETFAVIKENGGTFDAKEREE